MAMLFGRILEFSVYGTIWLLLLFLVSSFTRKRGGILWQYFVSVCIALHLLMPVHIQWISLEPPLLLEMKQETAGEAEKAVDAKKAEEPEKEVKPKKAVDKTAGQSYKRSGKAPETDKEEKPYAGEYNIQLVEKPFSFMMMAEIIWIVGMLFFFGRTGISYLAFCKQAKRWSLPADDMADRMLHQVQRQYGIIRTVRLWRNGKIESPMLYGFFRPVILLPDQKYSPQEYQYIFRHELSHYRHGDIGMKHLFTACRGVYWFHPLVQCMCRRADAQMEILCDESVIGGRNMEEKRAYGMIILRHMSNGLSSGAVPLTTNFYGGKNYMKMRFQNIMSAKKRKAGLGAVLAAALLVLALGGVKWSPLSTEANQKDVGARRADQKAFTGKKEISDRTIAVIGADGQNFADAILLLRVDTSAGTLSVQNVPRDLLVDFKDLEASLTSEQKKNMQIGEKLGGLSVSYGYGTLVGAMERIFKINIDSHIVLDYAAVDNGIDAVGGVKITLTKKEAEYLNRTNFITKKENRTVTAGRQIMNGNQAVGYMRIRSAEAGGAVVDGRESGQPDIFGRAERCNNVLLSLVSQAGGQKMDWKEMAKYLRHSIQETDIPTAELLLLAGKTVSGDLEVEVSKEYTSDDYIAEYNSAQGSYLRLKESGDSK